MEQRVKNQYAQLSIDFLFGILLLIGGVVFVTQFATGAIIPYTTTQYDGNLVTQKVSETLVEDERWFGTSEVGEVNLSDANRDKLSAIEGDKQSINEELGVPVKFTLNVTIRDVEGDVIEGFGRPEENTQATVYSLNRVGYDVDSGEKRIVKVSIW